MATTNAKFHVGQLVHHKLFGYRGVIIDADPQFKGSDTWYKSHAQSKPPKDTPWYHVLVDEADYQTYVAERNLEPDTEGGPIRHEGVSSFFNELTDDGYSLKVSGH
ncbi:MAG: heat shock protein HspQ [Rhodospirillales bacterium]|nr:heat shock protein HspQ [Rhodospirillales bacterium]